MQIMKKIVDEIEDVNKNKIDKVNKIIDDGLVGGFAMRIVERCGIYEDMQWKVGSLFLRKCCNGIYRRDLLLL